MSWIKRNLFFVVGSLVAVGLMAMAGFYLFQKTQLDSKAKEDLNQQYAELKRLYNAKPHPGDDKVDNVKEARKQQEVLRELLDRVRQRFQPIPPIPNKPGVRDEDFAAALRQTVAQLQRDAASASVTLPPNYDFSFKAVKPKVQFARGSLPLLAAQLGEVKAICDVLFRTKINSLESLRRERVSSDDDPQLSPADYLELKSVTNDLAMVIPYEASFRCFSSELGAVLDGFRQSPHGFIIKTLRVDPAASFAAGDTSSATATEAAARPAAPAPGQPVPARPGVASARGGLPIVINEKLLRVSLLLDVVKLLPQATSQP
jgi:hypothetical protein